MVSDQLHPLMAPPLVKSTCLNVARLALCLGFSSAGPPIFPGPIVWKQQYQVCPIIKAWLAQLVCFLLQVVHGKSSVIGG